MTVTTLAEIEACPRRWALGAAEYPGIWSGRGYPPRLQLSALAGTVVHLTLETITRELVRTACSSVEDSKAAQVMRDLGGYTKVVHACIDRVLERHTQNPRAAPLVENAARSLRAQASELRMRAQIILCRVRLPAVGAAPAERSGPPRRRRLTFGAYPEIELRARRIGWKGRADLLILSEGGCEISDFKTGAQDDSHRFQIRVYALLWSADEELNPAQRHAERLVLRYSGVDVEVSAPTLAELDDLESDIVTRRDAAQCAVSGPRPEARPTAENCRFCGVRQLCGEYWEGATQRALAASSGADPRFADVELTVTGRHGPLSWDAVIDVARDLPTGKLAVLRTMGDFQYRVGERLRVLDAAIAVSVVDDDQPVVITLWTMSEAYVVA
jgi:hypothetical protein